MTRRSLVVSIALAVAGCTSTPSAPPAPPKPLSSGLDLAAFDKTVRPQDDLFLHVNGGWLAKTEIPADKASYGSFDILFDKSQADLRAIVEEASKSTTKTPGSDTQKIGDFYDSFMNEARVEELGLTPLKEELAAIDALKTKTDLARHFGHFFKLNLINPIVGYVDGDAKEPAKDILYLYQGGLGLPDRDYYLKADPKLNEYRQKYVAFLTEMLKLSADAAPGKTAENIFALENRLARAHWTNVESRDAVKTYNKVGDRRPRQAIPRSRLDRLHDRARRQQRRRRHRQSAELLEGPGGHGERHAGRSLEAVSQGVAAERLRAVPQQAVRRSGVRLLSRDAGRREGTAAAVEARRQHAQRQSRRDARQALRRSAFQARSQGSHGATGRATSRRRTRRASTRSSGWDRKRSKQAQEKLAKFRPKIGYPNKWRDYSKLEIKKDDLVGNIKRAFLVENEFQLGKAGKPIDPEQWGMTPQTINAYYNPVRNEIVFPAAILQPPFFNLEADDAVNYGAIGGVIGHEMGHGFDDQGRRYDASGAAARLVDQAG